MRGSRISAITCLTISLVAAEFGLASGQSSRASAEQPRTGAPAATTPTAPVSEQSFVSQAAMANMAGIQISHMAVKKAQNDAVRKFASQMVDDHIKAQNDLADAAQGAGVQWPKRLDDKHSAIHARLSALNGPGFDREYLKAIIDGHRDVEKTLSARTGAGATASSELAANVAEWSSKTLPAVRAHLKKAEEMSAGLEQGK